MSQFSSCCGFACVKQSNVGIVAKWGSYDDVIPPGCTFIGCCGNSVAGTISLKTRLLHVHTKSSTSDKVIVDFYITVMYHVIPSECHTAYFALSNMQQISAYVDDAARGEIARLPFDAIFSANQHISNQVKKIVFPELVQRGFEVDEVLVHNIVVPPGVRQASEAQLENHYIRLGNMQRAEAQKLWVTIGAEAMAEVKRLQGVGAANMQKGVSGGFGDLIQRWEGGEQSSEVIAMMLMQQYIDTMKLIADGKTHSVLMPSQSIRMM